MLLTDVLVFLQEKDQKYVFASLVSLALGTYIRLYPRIRFDLEPLFPGPALHGHLLTQTHCKRSGKWGARSVSFLLSHLLRISVTVWFSLAFSQHEPQWFHQGLPHVSCRSVSDHSWHRKARNGGGVGQQQGGAQHMDGHYTGRYAVHVRIHTHTHTKITGRCTSSPFCRSLFLTWRVKGNNMFYTSVVGAQHTAAVSTVSSQQ